MAVLVAALLCAVLAGLGVGSGGIFVVAVRLFGGADQLVAQSLNLIFFAASSVAAIVINSVKGRVAWRAVMLVALAGCVTAVGGATIAHALGSDALGKLFGIMLIACGVISLLNTRKEKKDKF